MIRDFGVMKPQRIGEKCLDSQLWHACAGGMVQMPSLNTKVIYFPQGHAEHAQGVEFSHSIHVSSMIPCKVSSIKYLADPETDEVYSKISLIPFNQRDLNLMNDNCDDNDGLLFNRSSCESDNEKQQPASFAKTLTQSDANNGGGFSVPRYCAETIFPRLDYSAEPPVQTILAKDVHGETWKFRHIYRGTPRRHLLTTGWSNFVNQKKLIAGDSIVFLRADNGDLCVGIRRAKRGIGVGNDECPPSGWNSWYPGGFQREDESRRNVGNGKGKVKAESVIQAATLAANGQPFEVVYYPRASSPEFFVRASAVRSAMQIQWCPGMRFKMPFETEDSSRISWFMGTISSVQLSDPVRWPNSPWRLLQVAWDEPDLLQNVKRVSPWLVELVSNMPAIHLSPFSPPRKKMRLPQHQDFSLIGQLPFPSFNGNPLSSNSSSPLCCVSDHIPAGIQGARHTQFGLSLADVHFNKLHSSPLPVHFQQLDQTSRIPKCNFTQNNNDSTENISCLLTIGNPTTTDDLKESSETKGPHIFLFGQLILPGQQSSDHSCSSDNTNGNSSSERTTTNLSDASISAFHHQIGMQENWSEEGSPLLCEDNNLKKTDHCKVFMESEDVGRTLDLSIFKSYEQLHGKLANMFDIEKNSDMVSSVFYRDAAGTIKHTGDEPFSEFLKTTRRLTILTDSGSENIGR